ncbi:hypothetical protein Adt_11107 [Abeliophyllum distichum]|uniref:Uncharacterized protein n=1 Tax=Abeliophyllum distichum TaxID=126358 RepID=A0ABD1UNK8_9LAMI
MNGGYLENLDSDDEAKNYMQSVLMIPEILLLSPVMILRKEEAVLGVSKIRGGRVVDEKSRVVRMGEVVGDTLLKPIVSLSVEVLRDAPSVHSPMNVVHVLVASGSAAPAPVVGAPSVMKVRDDSSFSSSIVDVGIGSSSSSTVMEGEGEGDVQGCEVGPKGAQKRRLPDEGVGVDSGKAKKSWAASPQKTSGSHKVFSLEAQGCIPNSSYWRERINIWFRLDELDPEILERLSPPSTMVVAFVHKYWTTIWAKATDGADLHKMIRIAEMNTVQSHVLNCELYKVFSTKVDELRS